MDQTTVYELDIDGLIAELGELLTDQGFEVTEQVPAGVWWFRTNRDAETVRHEIGEAFAQIAERRLRLVPE